MNARTVLNSLFVLGGDAIRDGVAKGLQFIKNRRLIVQEGYPCQSSWRKLIFYTCLRAAQKRLFLLDERGKIGRGFLRERSDGPPANPPVVY